MRKSICHSTIHFYEVVSRLLHGAVSSLDRGDHGDFGRYGSVDRLHECVVRDDHWVGLHVIGVDDRRWDGHHRLLRGNRGVARSRSFWCLQVGGFDMSIEERRGRSGEGVRSWEREQSLGTGSEDATRESEAHLVEACHT